MQQIPAESPFNLNNSQAYQRWRDNKLAVYPDNAQQLIVEINDPRSLTVSELAAMKEVVAKTNFCLYASQSQQDADKQIPHQLGAQLGLTNIWLDPNALSDDDGVTSLKVRDDDQQRKKYIPYTNKPLKWHTDGYYNEPDKQIAGVNLHCVRAACSGGENRLMDHEILYIQLREMNPEIIRTLMRSDVMTIPGNDDEGLERPARSGPVFSVNQRRGYLHMRYTARKRNISWLDDLATQQAVKAVEELLQQDSMYVHQLRMEAGTGLISNNVLHDRAGFENSASQQRLVYRARFYDRIAD